MQRSGIGASDALALNNIITKHKNKISLALVLIVAILPMLISIFIRNKLLLMLPYSGLVLPIITEIGLKLVDWKCAVFIYLTFSITLSVLSFRDIQDETKLFIQNIYMCFYVVYYSLVFFALFIPFIAITKCF
ncbi:MAG: hypothetical protein ACMUJM_25830 [bacterium]